MNSYEFLEHTADVKFRAYGKTLEEMLANAAQALFRAMLDLSTVEAKDCRDVELTADTLERLAYQWLSELIFLFDSEAMVFSRFEIRVREMNGWILEAQVYGERIDRTKHPFDCEVKAVTLHQFEVKRNDTWTLQAILDV